VVARKRFSEGKPKEEIVRKSTASLAAKDWKRQLGIKMGE
jgi:hypothetical protein